MVGSQSEQEMGGVVLPLLHSVLAHSLLGNHRPLQALRGTVCLINFRLVTEKTEGKNQNMSGLFGSTCIFKKIAVHKTSSFSDFSFFFFWFTSFSQSKRIIIKSNSFCA